MPGRLFNRKLIQTGSTLRSRGHMECAVCTYEALTPFPLSEKQERGNPTVTLERLIVTPQSPFPCSWGKGRGWGPKETKFPFCKRCG